MTKVKICGITNREDAYVAVDNGADALGFIFYEKSPRYIVPDEARKIIVSLPPFVVTVGVFVNSTKSFIHDVIESCNVNVVQLHGDEPPEFCNNMNRPVIKVISVKDMNSISEMKKYSVSSFLLDTYSKDSFGGTGKSFNWDIAFEGKKNGKVILSGGLNPDNIQEAISKVDPYAVDTSSGVELYPGKKDKKKIQLFIERARRTFSAT